MTKIHFFLKETRITFHVGIIYSVLCFVFLMNQALSNNVFVEDKPQLFLDFELPYSPAENQLLGKKQITISPRNIPGGGHSIRVDYIGMARGSERVVVAFPLKRKSSEMSLCYDVLFPEGFKFVKGGKLHGLGPKEPVTGGKPTKPAGWSARVGFRPKGGVSTYIYDQNKKTKYGITTTANTFYFKPGVYHSVSLHIKLNTLSTESDGFVHLYIDGKPLVKNEKMKMRSTNEEESLVGTFLFSTFHGGSSIEYAPRTPKGMFSREHAHFDNIGVYEGRHVRPVPLKTQPRLK